MSRIVPDIYTCKKTRSWFLSWIDVPSSSFLFRILTFNHENYQHEMFCNTNYTFEYLITSQIKRRWTVELYEEALCVLCKNTSSEMYQWSWGGGGSQFSCNLIPFRWSIFKISTQYYKEFYAQLHILFETNHFLKFNFNINCLKYIQLK